MKDMKSMKEMETSNDLHGACIISVRETVSNTAVGYFIKKRSWID